tara:strand:- start:990 stop:1967 length:978 start_codon:yes stop_codon:yes gene_type:complete
MSKLNFNKIAKDVIDSEIHALNKLKKSFNNSFIKIVDLISKCQGKVILTGIGKSGLISRKISATLSSIGTPSFFLHPSEAAHGDLGQINKKDILLIMSYSGETEELKNIIQYCNRFSIRMIGVASKKNSLLLRASDIKVILPEVKEAGVGSIVPTSSTTMYIAFGDALSVALMNKKKFNKYDFKKIHPAGNLGKILTTVEDLMVTGNKIPFVNQDKKIYEALKIMTKKKLGALVIINKNKSFVGFVTDGDIRRNSKKSMDSKKIREIMTKKPIIISKTATAARALKIMNNKKITSLVVIEKNSKKNKIKVLGLIHLHSILDIGIQ